MNNMIAQAVEKIKSAEGIRGTKEVVMLGPVKNALTMFCSQNEEFAEAVVQGGSLQECLTECAKNIGTACSDEEVYARAVQFFFPGARVRFSMHIEMDGDEQPQESKGEEQLVIDIAEFI